jgi:hypothetical protein
MRKLLLAALIVAVPAASAGGADLVPFVLPYDDGSPGPTDLSGLSHVPAGKFGPVRAGKDGHLRAGGQRIRFLGVNCCGSAAAPAKQQAPRIAARLAKFGVNCVRFHHIDSAWSRPTLIDYASGTSRRLDAEVLDRLDYFVAQLKQRGIYLNINLLVSRRFKAGDGLPAAIERLAWKDQHRVGLFDAKMIELQKEYARNLLTHRNPYTKLRYTEDPAVAFVEICNENGLLVSYLGGVLDTLGEPFAGDLQRQWNAWLRQRYDSTEKLHKAWKSRREPLGESLLRNGDFAAGTDGWELERHHGAEAALGVADAPDGAKAARVQVTRPGAAGWHVQLKQAGLAVEKGRIYTVSFAAKADRKRRIHASAVQDGRPWGGLGLDAAVDLGTDWKQYRFSFVAAADERNARLMFTGLGERTGTHWFADVRLRSGGSIGLASDLRLEKGEIPTVKRRAGARATPEAELDFLRFLAETETAYWRTMRDFLKRDLKCNALVIGTIVGTSTPNIQAALDVIDSHAYWQHPRFPGRPWDPSNWFVRNRSMVNEPPGTIGHIAVQHVTGKPHVVSEYNNSAPNTYSGEGPLLIAAYAALQDLDGVFLFCYGPSWDSRKISGFFDICQHPTKMANVPAAAALFRCADVSAARNSFDVPLSKAQELEAVRAARGAWSPVDLRHAGVAGELALVSRIGAICGQAPPKSRPAPPDLSGTKVYTSDTGQLVWDAARDGKGVVTVNAPRTKAVIGFVAGRSFDLGGVRITPGRTRQDWCTVALTLMEGDSFARSGRGFAVATAYAENTDMGWKNEQKSSVGRDWGKAPSLIEVVPAAIELPAPAERVRCWAMDERGQRGVGVRVEAAGKRCVIYVGPPHKTLWYEIVIR